MRKLLFSLALILFASTTMAQFPMNREVQAALQNGTRTLNGQPGPNYWINRSDYDIDMRLDPASRVIDGSETITYTNNSPDALPMLVIRLYQDIFKKGGVRDEEVPPSALHDGVTLKKLIVAGNELDPNSTEGGFRRPVIRTGTNLIVRLAEPLQSGEKLTVEIDWEMIIPNEVDLRMGTYGKQTFFVAYWFPQIAVYDDLSGWDTYNYTGTTEMYNDFGSYDVSIDVPGDLMVWATGMLQNPQAIFSPQTLERYQQAQRSDEVIRIATAQDVDDGKILQAADRHSWQFKADFVPDFAFAVSDSFLWDASSVEVEPGRRVLVDVAYDRNAEYYDRAAEVAHKSVIDMSTKLPGVPYPYPQVSVFNGSGGMEFPMIVNDGEVRDMADLIDLTYHEIVHTYFPFYMGINERKYAWMDEGWATILPNDLIVAMEPDARDPMLYNSLGFSYFANSAEDVPLMTPTILLKNQAYGVHAYAKPASAYHILREMLGDEVFQSCLRNYIAAWNGKHPIPYDFFNSFNQSSGQNLDWFWQAWFFETGAPDLALVDVNVKAGKLKATVVNQSNIPVPVNLTVVFEDDSEEVIRYSAMVWKEEKRLTLKRKFDKSIKALQLGAADVPDTDKTNDAWEN
ncbi:MAG: M1 family metallopeptidase [Bacteroidota bacterium]